MATRFRSMLGALSVVFLLSACGGGAGASTGPGASTGQLSGTGGSPAPGASGPTGGAGGEAIDACSLMTGDEAAGAMHTTPMTATGTTAVDAQCVYKLDGDEAVRVDVVGRGGATFYASAQANGSYEPLEGIGDKALWDRDRLVFMVGEVYVQVFERYGLSADAAQAAAVTMGKLIAARLSGAPVPSGLAPTPPPISAAKAACDLLSGAEAAEAVGLGPMTATGQEGVSQFCTYTVDASGEVALGTYFQRIGGAAGWDSLAASLTTDPVSGLGERAMFEASSGILYVLQGDAILNANRYLPDPAGALEIDTKVLRVMLTHL